MTQLEHLNGLISESQHISPSQKNKLKAPPASATAKVVVIYNALVDHGRRRGNR